MPAVFLFDWAMAFLRIDAFSEAEISHCGWMWGSRSDRWSVRAPLRHCAVELGKPGTRSIAIGTDPFIPFASRHIISTPPDSQPRPRLVLPSVRIRASSCRFQEDERRKKNRTMKQDAIQSPGEAEPSTMSSTMSLLPYNPREG